MRSRNLRSLLLSTLLLSSVLAFSQDQSTVVAPPKPALTKEIKDEVLAKVQEVITTRAFVPGVDLSKWPDFIGKQQEAIDKAETENEFSRAVNAALKDFGFSHIRFLVPRAAQARVQTSATGIGLSGRAVDEGLRVTMVFPKSPADAAGIKVNDVITTIDGVKPESAGAMLGDDGTEVKMKVKGEDGVEKELTLTRKPYATTRDDTLTWFGDDSAVLHIHSFSKGYDRTAIEKLMKDAAKAKYLVLDLRSNGGGATSNLQHLLSLLMPADSTIGTFVSRRVVDQYKKDTGKDEADPLVLAQASTNKYKTRKLTTPPFTGKIAVLVNRGSASASEICAIALREDSGAIVVGSKSAGAVLASIFGKLPDGYELQYPIQDYVSFKGIRLEKNPIVPDIEVTARPEEGKPDPVIEQALIKLKG